MRSEEAAVGEDGVEEERVVDADGNERRRPVRRKLPFGRGAVLMVAQRSHIVGLTDVSVTGAYLTTRAPSKPARPTSCGCCCPRHGGDRSARPGRARVAQEHESKHNLRGVAVRFLDLDAIAVRKLRASSPIGTREATGRVLAPAALGGYFSRYSWTKATVA